jgi:hypothetical protein
MTMTSWDAIAFGREISAIAANRYAHAIVPTPEVTRTASFRLNLVSMVKGY